MDIKWVDGFKIRVSFDGRSVIISANREGLLALAGQLTDLAKEDTGSHIHYDENNSLEEDSDELIFEKI